MADESYEREPEQGQGSDEEQNLVNLRKAKEAAEKRAEEREQELAQIRTEQRQSQIASILEAKGLPSGVAKVYPADSEVTEEAVEEFATELGVAPQQPQPEPTGQETSYDAYQRLINQGTFSPTDSNEELMNKQLKGVEKLMNSPYKPTQADRDEHNQIIREINALNKRLDGEVKMGRLEPHREGFGGLVNPPAYADRAAQARQDI